MDTKITEEKVQSGVCITIVVNTLVTKCVMNRKGERITVCDMQYGVFITVVVNTEITEVEVQNGVSP